MELGSLARDFEQLAQLLDHTSDASVPAPNNTHTQQQQQQQQQQGAHLGPGDLLGLSNSRSSNAVVEEEVEKKKGGSGSIWEEDEVPVGPAAVESDGRERPTVELLHRQRVGAQDAYLGVDPTRDPSSSCCEDLLLRVHLPGVKGVGEIELQVTDRAVDVSSAGYKLVFPFPQLVDSSKASARWVEDRSVLELVLPKKELLWGSS